MGRDPGEERFEDPDILKFILLCLLCLGTLESFFEDFGCLFLVRAIVEERLSCKYNDRRKRVKTATRRGSFTDRKEFTPLRSFARSPGRNEVNIGLQRHLSR